MDDEKIKKLAAEYRKTVQERNPRKESYLEERRKTKERRKMLESLAPEKWGELRTSLSATVKLFNKELQSEAIVWEEDILTNRLTITRNSDGNGLTAAYNPAEHIVEFYGRALFLRFFNERIVYEIVLLDDRTASFRLIVPPEEGTKRPEEIADSLFRLLITAPSSP